MTGPVALWRNPVMLMSDIEIWERRILPDNTTITGAAWFWLGFRV